MMNGGVEYPRTHSTSPSETYAPYKPSPRIDPFEQPSCLGSTFVSEALRKSDQMHQTFEKSSLAMTHKLDDMIELPKSQSNNTYKEDLAYEIVMVKMPKCMPWSDAYDEPIGDLDMMEDKVDNPSPQSTSQVLPSFELCLCHRVHLIPLIQISQDLEPGRIPWDIKKQRLMKTRYVFRKYLGWDLLGIPLLRCS
ncbi:hypothetical protein Tco_0520501 [Tanacetum coccineum]